MTMWALILISSMERENQLMELYKTEAECFRALRAVEIHVNAKEGRVPDVGCFVRVDNRGIPR